MVLAAMVGALQSMTSRAPARLQVLAGAIHGGSAGGAGGRAVNVAHLYRQRETGLERWVVVLYSHLASIAPGVGRGSPVPNDGIIGTVGASGNAVTAHVHMEIHVRERPDSHSIYWLTPYDFFPGLQSSGTS